MGCWECFCCFCAGPLENPREQWIRHLREDTTPEDWSLGNKGDSIPAKSFDEIITISERDGGVWERCVCVTSEASESFVSPPCSVDSYGSAEIEGWDRKLHVFERILLIHPLWQSFFADESRYYLGLDDLMNGLLHCVDYGEMKTRTGQVFEYDFWEMEEGNASSPETTKELQSLLARPTYLPAPQKLPLLTTEGASLQPRRKVFEIPELLDNILDHIVDVPVNVIESELKVSHEIFEAQSAVTAAKALLSLAQVNRSFYQAVVGNRQDLFLTAIRNFGWMLPFSPADWSDSEWPDAVLEDTALMRGSNIDWRTYMLNCIRKTTPNLRNRWRLHKMAVQFARGSNGHRFEKNSNCVWNAGSLGFKSDLQKSDASGWEVNVRWW
ncbi:hypothetical protein FBEOM_405 [Fusarium beomiforme]|uniref:Uncharacterized protein n=1 Tax=Fusarium beomiforme TaxID=44412 RepID=A0A9P5E555_9HYPO|nr:hypothetical protein FBEOM_405 [Fusarium beomiforme]